MSDAPATTIALAGNPNAGKTTVFNALTGSKLHVGNYPGVTVETAEAAMTHDGAELTIVDLPGTYSLTPHTAEEIVARTYLIERTPDVVIDIIDASNLERNLYLATQLLELGVPLVLAFNMSDVAAARGTAIDTERLSQLLGAPIVSTVGHKGGGMDELIAAAVETARAGADAVARQRKPEYSGEIAPHVREMTELIERACPGAERARWYAVKLLEGDEETSRRLRSLCGAETERLEQEAARLRGHIEGVCGDAIEIIFADRRYGFISGACTEAVRATVEVRHERSDRIDEILTHRTLGLPIFAGIMYLMFHLVFTIGAVPVGWLEAGFEGLGGTVGDAWPEGAAPLLRSMIVDGVIGGVGGVLVFVPNIVLLFVAIALLEDSGYMARAAFIMDQWMHRIGLHGKSFIPMLTGFGCTVPAILATRTLETRRDRLVTMLVVPLMSCGARLPIYVLVTSAFFPQRWQAPVMWSIYAVGVVLAVVCAKILRSTLFKGDSEPFVMELPPYRLPTAKGLALHAWEPTWMYIRKAGTVILAFSIVLWAITTFPRKADFSGDYAAAIAAADTPAEVARLENQQRSETLSHTVAGRLGRAMAPALHPLGFDWKIGVGLVGALGAKEVFVSQLGVVYAVGEADESSATLRERLRADYTPLVGYCIMLFCLITAPCAATVAMTGRESGSWKWAAFQLAGLTILAYLVTLAVYQIGSLLGAIF